MSSKFYLSTLAPGFTPSVFQGAWDNTSQQITRALNPNRDLVNDTILTKQVSESVATNNWDVLAYVGVSAPLAGQTISGNINMTLSIWESFTSDNIVYHVHVWVTQGDSDTPRGTLLTDFVDSSEFSGGRSAKAFTVAQTLSDLAINEGDRLVIEIGGQFQNTKTSGAILNLDYGTGNNEVYDDITVGSNQGQILPGHIDFSNNIEELVEEQRYTQLAVETGIDGVAEQRYTQLALETGIDGTAEQRYTQLAIEVATVIPAVGFVQIFVNT